MKISNILLIGVAILIVSWVLIDGWFQVEAYYDIKSGKPSSYAEIGGPVIETKLLAFKNIKVEVGKNLFLLMLNISHGDECKLEYGKELKKGISCKISGDTLYLNVRNENKFIYTGITVNLPELNSVNLSWAPNVSLPDKRYDVRTTIYGFTGKCLSLNNGGQNKFDIDGSRWKKLLLRGNYDKSDITITNYADIDSLDFDIDANKEGSLNFAYNVNKPIKENPNQWVNIKVPEYYRVQAYAKIAGQIKVKKSPKGSDFIIKEEDINNYSNYIYDHPPQNNYTDEYY